MINAINTRGRLSERTCASALSPRTGSTATSGSVPGNSDLACIHPPRPDTGEINPRRSANHGSPRRGGFTLIEMLIVVTIILVIAGLLTPAINKMMEVAARQKAATRLQAVVLAIKKYKNMYQKWPGQTEENLDGSIDQKLILPTLMSNPRGEIIVDVQPDWTNNWGELVDVWDQKCQIVMDEDDDGIVQIVDADLNGKHLITTNIANASVAVISWGPKPPIDRKRIYSWRH